MAHLQTDRRRPGIHSTLFSYDYYSDGMEAYKDSFYDEVIARCAMALTCTRATTKLTKRRSTAPPTFAVLRRSIGVSIYLIFSSIDLIHLI